MSDGRAALLVVLLLLCYAAPVRSQQPSQAQLSAIRENCREDYKAQCSGVPSGGREALTCLQGHAESLSPPCQQAVAAVSGASGTQGAPPPHSTMNPSSTQQAAPRQEMALLRQSCGADYRTYCRGVRPGGGRALACLEENRQSLSPQCQNALMAAKQRR
jgi:hypothetical protein